MSCDVCQTIIEIYSAPFEEPDAEFLGQVSSVLNSNCPHAESLGRAANFDRHISDFPDEFLAIRKVENKTGVRLGLAGLTPQETIFFYNVSTTWMDLVARDDQPDHPGRANLPDPKWIDLNIVRDWISICKNEHQGQCHEPPWLKGVSAASPDWFIDVIQECIVPAPGGKTNYVALSYTWGLGRNLKNTKATLQELQQLGALKLPHFAAQLPETIRNTIDLVRLLGERYLWVDALCIVQDDPASLERNLNQMQLIYANSVFCIMAATGCGAEFGLRGLKGFSPARDLEMRVYDLADGDKLIAKSLSQDPTVGTKYSYHQRGWTFQEWLFSRRRLVFNHGPLEWQCQCAKWQENLKVNRQADAQWTLVSRPKKAGLNPSPSIWDFMQMASNFNTKALTIQGDAPKAFAGIQAMLHRVHPGGLIYGLSEFFFEISLAWSSLYSDVQRRTGSDAAKLDQDGLPSWSWLGWQGDITFPNDAEFQRMKAWNKHEQKIGFREPVAEWFTMASPNATSKRKIRSEWHRYRAGCASSMELPRGWTRRQYNPPSHRDDFFFPPDDQPTDAYIHELDPRKLFKYPVPVLNWTRTPTLSEQTQYLSGETSQGNLTLTSEITVLPVEGYDRRVCFMDPNRGKILSLTLQSSKAVEGFLDGSNRPQVLELVAFAKGWSTWLGDDVVKQAGGDGTGCTPIKLSPRVRVLTCC
ncbi:hypothetical protein ACJ41O_014226 [Fusarium nematophilum]